MAVGADDDAAEEVLPPIMANEEFEEEAEADGGNGNGIL